jgi:hypothetical protein
MQFKATLRNDILTKISTDISTSGTIVVYTGSGPGVANGATGTLLTTLTGVTFAAASGGTMTFTTTADSSAAASGTPGYARFKDSGATAWIECTAGISSGEFSFSGAVSLNGTVTETSGTFTAGNA